MHHHDHAHNQSTLDTAFKISVAINTFYVVLEAGAGFAFGSLALLADAAHNLTDVAGLLLAWGATAAARMAANERYTYGYGRSTLMAALVNAVVILVGVGAVIWEAVHRFAQPTPIQAPMVMAVAFLGILVNGGTALLFKQHRHGDVNIEGAFLHMMTDAAVSLAVVLGGGIVMMTGWMWVDPVVAIGVSAMVAVTTFGLFKTSFHLTLDGVPESVDAQEVQAFLLSLNGVTAIHDLHIWALSTTKTALTVHLVVPEEADKDLILGHLAHELEERFHIHHATIQIEKETNHPCGCC